VRQYNKDNKGVNRVGVELNVFISFLAGLLSFLSPCVLAIAPAYITYISGVEATEGDKSRVITHTILFVMGFTGIFVLMGLGASFLGSIIAPYRVWFNRLAGAIIIVFGLQILGVLKIRWLYADKHFRPREITISQLRSLVLGISFGLGWTPCVGPILGSILLYASTLGKIGQGGMLLFFYALGLALPFIFLGIGWGHLTSFFRSLQKRGRWVEIISGILLIFLGVVIFTGEMNAFLSLLGMDASFNPEFLLFGE